MPVGAEAVKGMLEALGEALGIGKMAPEVKVPKPKFEPPKPMEEATFFKTKEPEPKPVEAKAPEHLTQQPFSGTPGFPEPSGTFESGTPAQPQPYAHTTDFPAAPGVSQGVMDRLAQHINQVASVVARPPLPAPPIPKTAAPLRQAFPKPAGAVTDPAAARVADPKAVAVPPDWKPIGKVQGLEGGHKANKFGGGWYEDPSGQRWYVKNEIDEAHARNEMLANQLYKLAGVEVPETQQEGRTLRAKGMSGNVGHLAAIKGLFKEQAYDTFKKDWAADGWVSNWDVHEQNVLVDKDNPSRIMRIDPGGALDYTGWGAPKRTISLGEYGLPMTTSTAKDFEMLRYGIGITLTNAEALDSAQRLMNIKREDVFKAVQQYGPRDPIAQRNLTNLLMRRRNNVLELMASKFPGIPFTFDQGRLIEIRRGVLGRGMVGTYLPSNEDLPQLAALDKHFNDYIRGMPGFIAGVSDPATALKLNKHAHEAIASVSDYMHYDAGGTAIDPRSVTGDLAKIMQLAREKYYPGVVITNANVLGKEQTLLLNLDGPLLRSAKARFDPSRIHLQDLLAGGAAITISPWLGSMIVGEAKAAQPGVPPEGEPIEVQVGNQTLQFPPGTSREDMHEALMKRFGVPADKSGMDVGKKPGQALYGAEEMIREAEKPESVLRVRPSETGPQRVKELFTEGGKEIAHGMKVWTGQDKPDRLNLRGGPMARALRFSQEGGIVAGLQKAMSSWAGLVSPTIEEKTHGVVKKEYTEALLPLGLGLLAPKVPYFGKTATATQVAEETGALQKIISNDLFKLRNWITADKAEVSQFLKSMPKEFQTAEVQKKMYLALEDPSLISTLSPGERAAFNKYILPMRKEIQKLSQVAGDYKVPLDDDQWVHRVVAGQEPVPKETGAADVPQLGTRSLPRSTGTMQERAFFVLEDETGARAVVSQPRDGQFTIWSKGKPKTYQTNEEMRPGNVMILKGKQYVVKEARTPELEAETPYRFQQSAAVNLGDSLIKMRGVVRNIKYLDMLTQSPEWNKWATKNPRNIPKGKEGEGWDNPKIPQLKEWYVHPKIKSALDDFYRPGIEGFDAWRRANRWLTGTLFWNPLPHAENVLGHWVVARGWDWLPFTGGWKSIFMDGAKAIKAVTTLDDNYKRLLKDGNALIYGGVHNADFYKQLGNAFGLHVARQGDWVEKLNGIVGAPLNPTQWARSLYEASNRIMWAANDVMMMQRVLELERKGYATKKAIEMAEKHIPNYRIPPEVLGSRDFSRVLQDPAIFNFSRYHYGMWNSYMNMIKDLVGPKASVKERVEAVGNMMALGMLVFALYPALDYGFEKMFGDSKVRKLRRGPAAIPDMLYKINKNERQFADLLSNTFTMAPVFRESLEQGFNRDFFTGKRVAEPQARTKDKVGQRLEHAANALLAPYTQTRQTMGALDEKGLPRKALDTLIGLEDKTARQRKGLAVSVRKDIAAAKARRKHPMGPIEKAFSRTHLYD